LLLLCYGVESVHENSIDLQALLDFKQGVHSDPYGALSNWTLSSHFCHWNGVTCTTTRPWRVQKLLLNASSLAGQISSSLGNLTFLYELDLSNNSFTGPLPLLGGLQQLQYLFLNNNNLSGSIPDELTNSSILASLDLSSNLLVGSIPPKLGLLSKLTYLKLRSNRLEGSIPSELGQLLKLKTLLLDGNRLSGEIPHAIFQLSSLEYLGLYSNMLGKTLPPNLGDLLPNLTEIELAHNNFEGDIPASLGNATRITKIGLSFNNFTGKVPVSLGKLSRLISLNLEGNHLVAREDKDWEFLDALANCKSLQLLSLASNNLEGSLPASIGNLSTSLEHLLLGANSLSGQIPHSIGKLSTLIRLGLSGNYFSGTIEGWIENFKSLQQLMLNSNNFTGSIPIDNLTELLHLDLSDNDFEGPIPTTLGNLLGLQWLYLSYNNLQGYIPPNFGNLEQLIELNLSNNNIQGDIPRISSLQQLSTLDISRNKLTGQIPGSLGQCLNLVNIKMDHNFLTGSIPSTFGNLSILTLLNLSHNNLSGTIPQALSALKSLRMLDLSYNSLHGDVPTSGIFENATAVSLGGNQGLCGGTMDLRMPSCTAASKKTEYYLIRVLIPIFGFMSLVLLGYMLILAKKMPRREHLSLNYFGENFLKVSYNDLAQATSNFAESNLIGRGSYGSVYRGKLKKSKMEVAVKVFDLEMGGAEKSFMKECEVLRSIQHRNLLPIVTACSTVDNTGSVFKALVYEFMANGNLDKWLHHRNSIDKKPLSLTQRLSIAVNIADALDYIHHDSGKPTIHCDLKPSNILLDDDMTALLADFGIASFYQHPSSTPASSTASSVGMKGTIGYIAPEYAGGGRHAATSDDVYGFGIILLEMMTGRRPTDPMFKDGVSIINFVEGHFPHEIFQVLDAHLTEEYKNFAEAKKISENAVHQCLVSVIQVAFSCTKPIPSDRMNMKEIATRMHTIQSSYVSMGKQSNIVRPLGVELPEMLYNGTDHT